MFVDTHRLHKGAGALRRRFSNSLPQSSCMLLLLLLITLLLIFMFSELPGFKGSQEYTHYALSGIPPSFFFNLLYLPLSFIHSSSLFLVSFHASWMTIGNWKVTNRQTDVFNSKDSSYFLHKLPLYLKLCSDFLSIFSAFCNGPKIHTVYLFKDKLIKFKFHDPWFYIEHISSAHKIWHVCTCCDNVPVTITTL